MIEGRYVLNRPVYGLQFRTSLTSFSVPDVFFFFLIWSLFDVLSLKKLPVIFSSGKEEKWSDYLERMKH